ncbi:MAG: hypothetical protein R6U78_03310 [Bacteroidales bacterium]
MKSGQKISRREFAGTTAAAAAFTIFPTMCFPASAVLPPAIS